MRGAPRWYPHARVEGGQDGRPESRAGRKRCTTPWTRCEENGQGEVKACNLSFLGRGIGLPGKVPKWGATTSRHSRVLQPTNQPTPSPPPPPLKVAGKWEGVGIWPIAMPPLWGGSCGLLIADVGVAIDAQCPCLTLVPPQTAVE